MTVFDILLLVPLVVLTFGDSKFNGLVRGFLALIVGIQKMVNATLRGINESILAAHSRLIKFSWVFDKACDSDRVCRVTGNSVEGGEGVSDILVPILPLPTESVLIPASA